MTEDERWAYSQRLMRRLNSRIVKESPGVTGLSAYLESDHMRVANEMLEETLGAWEKGGADKKELDQKAAGYLSHWREGLRTWPTMP